MICKSVYILKVYSIHYKLKKSTNFLQKKKMLQKMHCFSQAWTHHGFTFNLGFLYELKFKIHLSKTMCVAFDFWFHLIFIKVHQKSMDPSTLKLHDSFQNKNNRKVTHSFASRTLIVKLGQEVWRFNDICIS